MWKKQVVRVMVALNLVLGLCFITTFRENLHCTQYTSFRIAAFDMIPHVEEAIDGPTPLVYGGPFAVVLRTYFSVVLLGFVFWPSVSAIAVLRRCRSPKEWFVTAVVLLALLVVNAVIPNAVSGERWSALNAFAVVVTSK